MTHAIVVYPKATVRYFSALTTCIVLAIFMMLSPRGNAQEFRGGISGTVTDPSGAIVKGAQVTVTETDTGTVNKTTTDGAGQYRVPFLPPGAYRISVAMAGFKTTVRDGITLQSNEQPVIDLVLALGNAQETVSVTAAAPLVDTANASVGQVITSKQVEDFPVNGRTPVTLAELSIGVLPTSQPSQIHPFDNSGGSSWSIGGTVAQTTEMLLDGAPDMTWQGDVAYNAPQEAVKELSVSVSDTDAAFGHTIGGVINQITKSGTNSLHGSLYEFGLISDIAANSYFNKHSYPVVPRPTSHFNQYGLSVGGPVFVPKIYDGRNKLFFFFAWEGLPDSTPATSFTTVPTIAERQGDFSALLPLGCPGGYQGTDSSHCANGTPNPYQLYNPFTAQLVGSKVVRTPIPNNILTNAGPLSPVALAYLKYYPQPNVSNPNPDGENNYISNAPATDTFNSEFSRVDWNISNKDHVFGDFRHNHRVNHKNDLFLNGASGQRSQRINYGSTLDNVYTLNNTTVLDVRANWNYYNEPVTAADPTLTPGSVGFPSYMTTSSLDPELPYISPGYTALGYTGSGDNPTTIYQLFGDAVKTIGRDTLKFGADVRQYRVGATTYGAAAGTFTFGSNFVQSGSAGSAPTFGGPEASFLLGLPTSGSYFRTSVATFNANYFALFVQNDWRVSNELTLNLGVRFDHQSPYEEKFSRVTNGFDPGATTNISSQAAAAYAGSPIPQVPPSAFNTLGGLTYPTNSRNGAQYQTKSHWVSPRIGFSYNPAFGGGHTVWRGGFAMFVLPASLDTLSGADVPGSNIVVNQQGFSSTTSYVATNDNYLTAASVLDDPFPSGFVPATGSSLGASTDLGQSITYYAPHQIDPYALRWNLGVQHSFTSNLMFEIEYLGNHAVHQPIADTATAYIPHQFLSRLPVRDTALINEYTASVKNPFAGLLPGTSINGSTVALSQLLSTYPQFTGITEQNNTEGSSIFNSLNVRVEKRMSHGLSLTANYSFSKLIESMAYLNDGDTKLTRVLSPYNYKHHFVMGATYELPIGRGKLLDMQSGVLNSIFGGFRLNGVYSYQSGPPALFSSDLVTTGQPITIHPRVTTPGKALNTAAFDTKSADQFSFHLRTLPLTFSSAPTDGINQLDASILKNFYFPRETYFQLRFETFNALNHASFASPNVTSPTSSSFGTITSQANSPRSVQIGGRFVF